MKTEFEYLATLQLPSSFISKNATERKGKTFSENNATDSLISKCG
jgi:hypothetical protein